MVLPKGQDLHARGAGKETCEERGSSRWCIKQADAPSGQGGSGAWGMFKQLKRRAGERGCNVRTKIKPPSSALRRFVENYGVSPARAPEAGARAGRRRAARLPAGDHLLGEPLETSATPRSRRCASAICEGFGQRRELRVDFGAATSSARTCTSASEFARGADRSGRRRRQGNGRSSARDQRAEHRRASSLPSSAPSSPSARAAARRAPARRRRRTAASFGSTGKARRASRASSSEARS